jgi:hypothetical protein
MSIRLMTIVWEIQTLTSTQKLILLALADNASDEGICWPSLSTIARKSSLARSTVADQLNDLEKLDLIARDRGSIHRSTVYTVKLMGSPPAGLVRHTDRGSPLAGLGVVRQPDGGSPPHGLKPSSNHQIEPSLNTQNVREVVDIVALKLAYPRGTYAGVAWMDAERACNQLLEEGETPETILESVNQYADQQVAMGRIGTQFITSPAKFFRSGLWRGPFPLPEKPQTVKPKSTWLEQEDDDAQS